MYYGKHLLVEGLTKTSNHLTDQDFIEKVFDQIIKKIQITAVLPPIVYQFPPRVKNKQNTLGGITAFYIIAESHLSIHTWPENNYFAFDLFSCKDFNETKVLTILKHQFDTKNLVSQVIERGIAVNFKT